MKSLEEKLDRVFSIFIRLKYADYKGYVGCYTCETIITWQEAQCGHFNLRGNDATRFDERNCRPQCYDCNINKNGMPESFEEHLREELGDEEFEDLVATGRGIKKFTEEEYREKIKHYTAKVRELGVII